MKRADRLVGWNHWKLFSTSDPSPLSLWAGGTLFNNGVICGDPRMTIPSMISGMLLQGESVEAIINLLKSYSYVIYPSQPSEETHMGPIPVGDLLEGMMKAFEILLNSEPAIDERELLSCTILQYLYEKWFSLFQSVLDQFFFLIDQGIVDFVAFIEQLYALNSSISFSTPPQRNNTLLYFVNQFYQSERLKNLSQLDFHRTPSSSYTDSLINLINKGQFDELKNIIEGNYSISFKNVCELKMGFFLCYYINFRHIAWHEVREFSNKKLKQVKDLLDKRTDRDFFKVVYSSYFETNQVSDIVLTYLKEGSKIAEHEMEVHITANSTVH